MANHLTVSTLLERNKAVAAHHQPIPTFTELAAMNVDKPRILILTCVDPRVRPEYFLNLQPEDGVLVLRNICGHVAPNIYDILALEAFINLREILIVHHTDCGASHFTDNHIQAELLKRVPGHDQITGRSFGAFTDLEQSIKDDLAVIKSSPFIGKELAENCWGVVYDLKTGRLESLES